MSFDLYQFVQILYWLALSTAFGGVLFVALAAPVVFRTVRERNPVLPEGLADRLEGEGGTLLAGLIVGNLLSMLGRVQAVCLATLLLCMVAQFFLIDLAGGNHTAMLLRVILFLGAAGAIAYDRLVVWPRLLHHRRQYIEHGDEPEVADPAREAFDREHRRSVTLLGAALFLLMGMILFSANITPRPAVRPPSQVAHTAGSALDAPGPSR